MNGTERQAIHNGSINGKGNSTSAGSGQAGIGLSGQSASDDEQPGQPMQQAVIRALEQFWDTLEGDQPSNLYELVINHVERPLLETVMVRCEFNQSRAAQCLGITRSTLRKKLRCHGLIDNG